jgi:hypothetical protein
LPGGTSNTWKNVVEDLVVEEGKVWPPAKKRGTEWALTGDDSGDEDTVKKRGTEWARIGDSSGVEDEWCKAVLLWVAAKLTKAVNADKRGDVPLPPSSGDSEEGSEWGISLHSILSYMKELD